MSLAPFWIVFIMGAAWAAPTTPSSGTQPKFEHDSQMQNGIPKVNATFETNRTESAAKTFGVELPSEFPEEAECHNSWQRFLVDFDVHYSSEAETEKRSKIFCANWKRIQEHNVQYEVGKVSFKKKINQWADLTLEEWMNKQRPNLAPEFSKAKPTTEASAVDQTRIKCEAAWQKFLIDFSRKYENEAETEKRHSIFCDNWQRIQEHNLKYEAGLVSHKKGINQWTDLTFEEWRKTQEPHFPPNLETPGNKTEASEVHEYPERSRNSFPANTEEPGVYVVETTMKLKLDEQPVEVPIETKDLENPFDKELSENEEKVGSQKARFPPNMEEPGTYIVKRKASKVDQKGIKCQAAWEKFLIDFSPKYENGAETKIRKSIFCANWQRIQEHNILYEAGKVFHKKSINQWSDLTLDEWKKAQEPKFPPNMETPGNKTEASEVDQEGIKCQAAWEKFLTDFNRKYENEAETQKRRGIFCNNFKRILEHNILYEAGKVSHKKSINQWSDLTFVEWKKTQEPKFPPNMETPGSKTEPSEVQENPERTPFPPNTEAPGTYVQEVTIKCQAAWRKFLADYSPKYANDAETKIRESIFCHNWQRIQEHNAQYQAGKVSHKESISEWSDLTSEELKSQSPNILPPNLRPTEHEREATIVQVGSQQVWFPPNMEEPGIYVVPSLVDEGLTDEVPRIESETHLAKPTKKSDSSSEELIDRVPSE